MDLNGKQALAIFATMRQLWILFMFVSQLSWAQMLDSAEYKSVVQLGISAHYGFILVHSKDVRELDDSYPFGLQLDLAWQYRKRSAFDQCNCFPKVGAMLQLWNYDNPSILGNGAHLLFFIEPEYGAGRTLSFAFRAGYGLSYSTKPYHPIDNPNNQSYSTPVNFALYLGLRSSLRISNRSRIGLAAHYNHISNGGIKKPNKGINFPTVSLTYDQYLSSPDFPKWNRSKWDGKVQKRIDLSFLLAWQQVEDGVHLLSPGLELKGSRQVSKINAITLAGEFLNDNFDRHQLEKQSNSTDWRKGSLLIGHEFLLGRLRFGQQIGFYIYKPNKGEDDVYQRYALSYSLTNWMALGVNIKAHRHVADLVDYRLIFSF